MKKILNFIVELVPYTFKVKLFFVLQRSIRNNLAIRFLKTQRTVVGGKFSGMQLPQSISVQNYTLAHMLGVYEQNIQALIIEKMKSYNRFIDIGCASGVFSVGVPFVTGKTAIGFDVDKTQVNFANHLAKLNNLEDKAIHNHVSLNEDYNNHLQNKDLCLVDIEGNEVDLLKLIKKPLRDNIAWIVEVHEIGKKTVEEVLSELINLMSESHSASILNEYLSLDYDSNKLQNLSRNEYAYFANGQRDYFQKWVIFEPK